MIVTLYYSRRLYYTLFEHEYQGTADELCDALWDGVKEALEKLENNVK